MSTRPEPRELWFAGPKKVELRSAPRVAVGARQIRARGLASGISQGTEMLLYRGEGPTPFDSSLDPAGAPTYPRRYGYAWVGEVVELGAGSRHAIGDRVFSLAPHGDEHVLDDDRARPLGASVPAPRATLAASLETAITCVWDGGVELGDEVVVLGGGVIGALTAWLAARIARRVTLVEPALWRREVARAIGLSDVAAPEAASREARADVVFEATGDPRRIDDAVAWAGSEATVVVASFYGTRSAPTALGDAFHRRRLSLRSSQVSRLPPRKTARWDNARRFDLVRDLLGDQRLDALIDPAVPFEDASTIYAELDRAPVRMQTVFVYR